MGIVEIMNRPGDQNAGALALRFAALDRRISSLERRLTMLEGRTMTDQARYSWGDGAGDPYYHRPDLAGSVQTLMPYVSTTSRFVESLTSPKMVKTIAGEAAILGLSFAGLGLAVHLGLDIPVRSIPALGIGGFAIAGLSLVIINRSELHRLVTAQNKAGQRSRQELRIQVDKPDTDGKLRSVEFLLVSGITPAQLSEWAGRVLDGADLAIKGWVGQGALFSEGQYTALMKELERAGYVLPGRGNISRSLDPKSGRALMRQLAKF